MNRILASCILALLAGCTHPVTEADEASVDSLEMDKQSKPQRAPKARCGQMPPVDKEKIILMLTKSGKITASMSEQERHQVLSEYLNAMRARYASLCK